MSSIIQTMKRTGALLLLHDYRLGHTRDLSGNARHGVGTDLRWWRRSVGFPLGTSKILVANDATLNALTNCTFLVWVAGGRRTFGATGNYIAAKGTGATTSHYTIRNMTSGNDRLALYSSTNVRVATVASAPRIFYGPVFMGLEVNTATACLVYADGKLYYTTAGSLTVVTTNDDLTIGALGGPANQTNLRLHAFAIVNRVMTSLEHAQFYSEMCRT